MKEKRKIHGLDLFSGIGGITKGLEQWVKPIAYCDNNPYAQAVLLSRMADGHIPRAPIWDDVKTLKAKYLPKGIDIIYGGFPCQDLSYAGLGKGLEGERSGLFFEIVRLAQEIQPPFLFLENVIGIRTRGLRQVVGTLANMGYDCRWTCVSAREVGAKHDRKRWFLLAYSNGVRQLQRKGLIEDIGRRLSDQGAKTRKKTQWRIESSMDRMAHGIPFRVDRTKSLGNAVVPQQVAKAFEKLLGLI